MLFNGYFFHTLHGRHLILKSPLKKSFDVSKEKQLTSPAALCYEFGQEPYANRYFELEMKG